MSFPIYYRTPSLGGVIMGGGVLFAVAFWLFSRLDADSSMWSIAWREMVMGVAMAVHMPALSAAGVPPRQEARGAFH
jgi:hypothetical protein